MPNKFFQTIFLTLACGAVVDKWLPSAEGIWRVLIVVLMVVALQMIQDRIGKYWEARS